MNENGSSKLDTVLRIMMIAFISLLAFSSGVWFGKKLSDSDYQLKIVEGETGHGAPKTVGKKGANGEEGISEDEVAELAENAINKQKGGHGPAEGTVKPGAVREVASDTHGAPAKGKKTDGKSDPHAKADAHGKPEAKAEKGKAAGHDAPTAKSGKPDLSAAHKAADRVANNEPPSGPAPKKPENRIPNSLPTIVGTAGQVEYTVQVASYPSSDAAKDHSDRLVKQGFPAFPVEAVIKGKHYFRVSVGSFKNIKEATTYQQQLLKADGVEAAIVQKIQRQ